ncbi:hypothetical protein CEG14_19570 [Bordetella genomosp. 1]|uniref:Uncharacterized protein n=1 Tax=Bordetella genomosp. 1 TaxID=1395607 RepID=A0A261S6S7_9BORD|nr:hypothetical protein [Bordetella genomosp. 1]MDQ8033926.1 hypothetical protein [Bordetella sp.]OZI33059.1 hypothetical protein CEG14_19570 [Bordetella genomosp. 1]
MRAAEQIISEQQQARKVATLWADSHGQAVLPCVECAEHWFRQSLPIHERTWRTLEMHLRAHFPLRASRSDDMPASNRPH